MRVLAIDLSTKSGWALFEEGRLVDSGALTRVPVEEFNVNQDPQLQPSYPYNLISAANAVANLVISLVDAVRPDEIVVENSVKGRNRHTQRLIEWLHLRMLQALGARGVRYMDPSEWRRIVEMRLSKDDKKNNRAVSDGKKRGRVTRKHLSVRMVNERFSSEIGHRLKLKDNDQADAILLGLAYMTVASTANKVAAL